MMFHVKWIWRRAFLTKASQIPEMHVIQTLTVFYININKLFVFD